MSGAGDAIERAGWIAALETERPDHPLQLANAAHLDRVAWERTQRLREWRRDLRAEFLDYERQSKR